MFYLGRGVRLRASFPALARVGIAHSAVPHLLAATCRGTPRSSPNRRHAAPAVPQARCSAQGAYIYMIWAGMAGCWVVYTSPDCPSPALGRPLLYPTTSLYLVRICLGWGLKASPGGSLVSQSRQMIPPLSPAGTAPRQLRGRRIDRGPAPPARPRNAYYLVSDLLGLGRDSPLWPYTSVTFPTNRFRARDGWASSW